MKRVVYPGSFDPITNGHLDIIRRARQLFDLVIIGVAEREEKRPLFSLKERVDLVKEVVKDWDNVEVYPFSSLLVDFVREKKAIAIIRGIRAVADFDYEFQMALTNRKIAPEIETIFLLPSQEFIFLSASLVKEIAKMGGCVKNFVPQPVAEALRKKFPKPEKE
uniref:Phosphopantetheine adenylyltransferase n=1 Tax=candidate division WOR-3 bacterium TaxID=2052148 RepID=A0A7C3YP33_UNCW3